MPKFTTPDRPKCAWVTGARSQDRAPFELRHPTPTLGKLISFECEPPATVCVTRSRFSVTESAPRMGRLSIDTYRHTCHFASAVNWRPAAVLPTVSCEALGSKRLAQDLQNRLSPDNVQSARTAPRRVAPGTPSPPWQTRPSAGPNRGGGRISTQSREGPRIRVGVCY